MSDSTGDTAKVSVEGVMVQTTPSPGPGGGSTVGGGAPGSSGGGALGWLTLLPFVFAAGGARRRHKSLD